MTNKRYQAESGWQRDYKEMQLRNRFLEKLGICLETTARCTPGQKGIISRKLNRSLIDAEGIRY